MFVYHCVGHSRWNDPPTAYRGENWSSPQRESSEWHHSLSEAADSPLPSLTAHHRPVSLPILHWSFPSWSSHPDIIVKAQVHLFRRRLRPLWHVSAWLSSRIASMAVPTVRRFSYRCIWSLRVPSELPWFERTGSWSLILPLRQ